MRKILTAGLAALTLAGGIAATATPTQAAPYHGGGGGWHGGGGGWHGGGGGWHGGGYGWHGGGYGYGPGGYLAAGVIGLGLGAALASSYNYGPGPYAYGPGPYYNSCYAPQQVWSPYAGRYVIEQVPYAC